MFKDPYEGKNAGKQTKKILILGESHYEKEGNKPIESTSGVVTYALDRLGEGNDTKPFQFFDKIVRSFGVAPENRNDFWDCVYFGNYVEEICGVGDSRASTFMDANKEKYNRSLFQFIEEHEISNVYCFGRGVFNHFPGKAECNKYDPKLTFEDQADLNDVSIFLVRNSGKKASDKIRHRIYDLNGKKVHFYGMLHPSGRYGFNPDNYKRWLKDTINLES